MNEPELNPYAAPQTTQIETVTIDSEAESLRRYCLSHETSIRSIALLYFLGAALIILVFSLLLSSSGVVQFNSGLASSGIVLSLILLGYGALAVFQLFVAFGLRKLSSFGRIGGTLLAVVGLIGFPIGTIISAYLLYLLWSEKGRIVFSPRYKQVILQTPHIKYKTSIIVKILLGILALFLFLMIFGLFLG